MDKWKGLQQSRPLVYKYMFDFIEYLYKPINGEKQLEDDKII